MRLGLALTSHCNAACTHCSTSCGPYRREALSKEDIFRLIDEAAAIDDGQPPGIDLTGGEPFLDFELLLAMVAYAHGHGAHVTCVTNAYWARSDEAAHDKLSRLRVAGLSALSVSVSRFHRRYVPLARVRRALATATSLGMATELKGAVTRIDLVPGGAADEWHGALKADLINVFPVLPFLREGAELPEDEYWREDGLPMATCPAEIVYVEPDREVSSCCTPGLSTGFLSLGRVDELPLAEIQRRFRERAKQVVLRRQGPARFALAAVAAGAGHRLRRAYAGPCDLCLHVASDPELRRIAEELCTTLEREAEASGADIESILKARQARAASFPQSTTTEGALP